MSKLIKYAETSSIMEIKIKYNDQIFAFNLDKELRVSETNVAIHIKTQTRGYAFLAMLHKKLMIKVRDEQKALNRYKYGRLAEIKPKFSTLKEAEANMSSDKKLLQLENDLLHLEEARDTIEVAVRAFEMRKDLIQTLSANIRKEKL